MYTKLEDLKTAEIINFYIAKNPHATRTNIVESCYTNFHRLKYLEKEGLIKLPPPLPFGERNGLKSLNPRNERENKDEVSLRM